MVSVKINYSYYFINYFFLFKINFYRVLWQSNVKLLILSHILQPNSYFLKKQASFKFFFFLFFLLQFYFAKQINYNFLLFFKKYALSKKNLLLYDYFFLNFKKNFFSQKNWLSLNQIFFFLIKTMEYKDPDFFITNFKLFFLLLPLFSYKQVFSIIIMILKFFSPFFFSKFSILGIYFSIRGKLGLKGGLKKKRLLYKFRKNSFSNTNLKLAYSQNFLQTSVGSIGLKLFIFY